MFQTFYDPCGNGTELLRAPCRVEYPFGTYSYPFDDPLCNHRISTGAEIECAEALLELGKGCKKFVPINYTNFRFISNRRVEYNRHTQISTEYIQYNGSEFLPISYPSGCGNDFGVIFKYYFDVSYEQVNKAYDELVYYLDVVKIIASRIGSSNNTRDSDVLAHLNDTLYELCMNGAQNLDTIDGIQMETLRRSNLQSVIDNEIVGLYNGRSVDIKGKTDGWRICRLFVLLRVCKKMGLLYQFHI